MSQSDCLAFNDPGLNSFLFSEIGTELNGSRLTILSVLARLGHDPWEVAARWVQLPASVVVDQLTQCLSGMPLCADSRAEVGVTAARLVGRLPARLKSLSRPADEALLTTEPLPKWVPAVLVAGLVFGIVFNMTQAPAPVAASPPKTAVTGAPPPIY